MVERDLSVPALSGVYALGDIARCLDGTGKPLPGLAQVAKQQGDYLGAALAEKLRAGKPAGAFVFTTAAILRSSADMQRLPILVG